MSKILNGRNSCPARLKQTEQVSLQCAQEDLLNDVTFIEFE